APATELGADIYLPIPVEEQESAAAAAALPTPEQATPNAPPRLPSRKVFLTPSDNCYLVPPQANEENKRGHAAPQPEMIAAADFAPPPDHASADTASPCHHKGWRCH